MGAALKRLKKERERERTDKLQIVINAMVDVKWMESLGFKQSGGDGPS